MDRTWVTCINQTRWRRNIEAYQSMRPEEVRTWDIAIGRAPTPRDTAVFRPATFELFHRSISPNTDLQSTMFSSTDQQNAVASGENRFVWWHCLYGREGTRSTSPRKMAARRVPTSSGASPGIDASCFTWTGRRLRGACCTSSRTSREDRGGLPSSLMGRGCRQGALRWM